MYAFSTAPIDFFAFSHGFSTQKVYFHSETTRTPFHCNIDFSQKDYGFSLHKRLPVLSAKSVSINNYGANIRKC
jgi:hypothetical protein